MIKHADIDEKIKSLKIRILFLQRQGYFFIEKGEGAS
jgi:hypothetical protein